MGTIYLTFNEDDPREAAIYSALESLGRKNKVRLIKLLLGRTVDDYGPLFRNRHAQALFDLISQSPSLPEPARHIAAAPVSVNKEMPAYVKPKEHIPAQDAVSREPSPKEEPSPVQKSASKEAGTPEEGGDLFGLLDEIHGSIS